ncbi:unnamed protein product [Durusdinium trenchii]|uniref:Anaphase-promoting complex subunit 1 n=2 Tax=Durusdinium trenchii TaxID=1381693 RepID=A0ABP0QUF5_9DINO
MTAKILDESLNPKSFQEYNLSRSLLQSPDLLWSPEEPSLAAAGAAGQFRNCLLLTDDQRLVACGLDRVSVRSLETGLAEEVLLPEAQWPMSNALAAGSPWLVLLRGHTLLLLHLGTAGASPRVWSRATVSAELGEVVAANWVEGFVEILFVQATSSALPSYRLTFVRSATTEDMEDLVLETVSHCFGSSPPLAASICNGRCLILSNGSYELERSAPPELDPNALGAGEPELAADEVDEELEAMMAQRGMILQKSNSKGAVLTLASPDGCSQQLLGLTACAAHSTQWGLVAVLRSQGHGALVHCWVEDDAAGAGCIKVKHQDTFPGLALCCATPGVAYLVLHGRWAALGRWSHEAVELFRHPMGARSSVTQGLNLDGASLQGLQLLEDQLFVWHSRGLLRFQLPSSESWGRAPLAEPHAWE